MILHEGEELTNWDIVVTTTEGRELMFLAELEREIMVKDYRVFLCNNSTIQLLKG